MKTTYPSRASGFTRIDLIAILALLSVLSLLGAQKMNTVGVASVAATCTGNMQQLMRSLHLYTADNADFLPPNPSNGNTTPGFNWLIATTDTAGVTNTANLINPSRNMLAQYLNGSASVFHCPADLSTVLVGATRVPRARSVSMNQAIGTNPSTPGCKGAVDGNWLNGLASHTANSTFRTYARLADVVNPRPVNLFVFLDEHPDSINDAGFGCMGPTLSGSGYSWIDWPATYHNKAGGLGFMDGHGEIHGWADPGTLVSPPRASSPQTDLAWLAAHATARVSAQP